MIQNYAEYKNSGVGWLGEIPGGWELVRISSSFRERREKVSDKDFEPLSVTKNGILPQLANAAKTNDGDNRKLVLKGDFVINSRSDRKGSSGVAKQDGSVSLINIVMEPNGIDPTFCNQLLKSNAFVEEYYRIGHGIVADLWTTRYSEMKTVLLALPPLPEQTAIANFLDDKTAKIEALVGIKRRQIELLAERKKILIQNAVTKGLNPDALMKNSRVDWIGEIPAHWEVKRLKHLSEIRYGLGQPPKESPDGLPLLRATNIERGKINPKNLIFVDEKDIPPERNAFLLSGEIIVVRSGAYTGDSAIIPLAYQGAVAGYDMVVSPTSGFDEFLALALLSPYVLFEQIYLERMRAAQPHLNREELSEILILCPPVREQQKIFVSVKARATKIDATITIKQNQITKLNEYKATLINAAVTGKIKVT